MKIERQWLVLCKGYVLLVFTDDGGYFAQTRNDYNFYQITESRARDLIDRAKK